MNINAITPGMLPSVGDVGSGRLSTPAVAPTSTDVPFSRVMNQFLHEVDHQQQVVIKNVDDLIAGKADNIHEIAISVAQADIAFRMVMEVRDKLISAYQEVMRMQV